MNQKEMIKRKHAGVNQRALMRVVNHSEHVGQQITLKHNYDILSDLLYNHGTRLS